MAGSKTPALSPGGFASMPGASSPELPVELPKLQPTSIASQSQRIRPFYRRAAVPSVRRPLGVAAVGAPPPAETVVDEVRVARIRDPVVPVDDELVLNLAGFHRARDVPHARRVLRHLDRARAGIAGPADEATGEPHGLRAAHVFE